MEAWKADWDSRDLDAVMRHYAEDVVLTSPTVVQRSGEPDGTIRGLQAVRAHFARGLEDAPGSHFALEHVLAGMGGYVAVFVRDDGNRAADVIHLDEQGRIGAVSTYYRFSPG
jgi:hypothetical protein